MYFNVIGFLCGSLSWIYSSKKETTDFIRLPNKFMASTERKNARLSATPSGFHTLACLGIAWKVCGNKLLVPSSFPISQVSNSAGLGQGLITWPSAKFPNEPNATDSEISEPLTHELSNQSLNVLLHVGWTHEHCMSWGHYQMTWNDILVYDLDL